MTESEMLASAVAGETGSHATLLKIYGPVVRASISPRIGDKYKSALDDDDVMSVTYCEAFLGIRRFKPGNIDGFVAWLRRIAKNNLLDAIRELNDESRPPRNRMMQPRIPDDDSHATLLGTLTGGLTTASAVMNRQENAALLRNAIASLPPDYRKVIELYDIQQASIAEVSKEMNRSTGAI